MKKCQTESSADDSCAGPEWLPSGPLWERFAPDVQHTVQQFLAPAYRQLVFEVGNPIQRAMGTILMHLSWLEAWNYQRLLESLVPSEPLPFDVDTSKARRISRHLELAAAKCQAVQLLARLRMVRDNLDPFFPPSAILPPQAAASAPQPQPEPCDESLLPPIGCNNQATQLERSKSVDQNESPALALVHAHPRLFVRQGAVVAMYRKVGQRTYGPYYRLAYRVEEQQRSAYIGGDAPQADAVRTALSALQVPWRRLRELDRCERDARRCLRLAKLQALPSLRLVGLRFHGSEIRGWRGNLVFKATAWRPLRRPPSLPRTPRLPGSLKSIQREAEIALGIKRHTNRFAHSPAPHPRNLE